MRNLLFGFLLGAALTAGVGVSAGTIKGPQLTGNSGPLKYTVVQEDEVICVNPWVSVAEKTIECYPGKPARPNEPSDPNRNVAE